jgi:hypothetical protein
LSYELEIIDNNDKKKKKQNDGHVTRPMHNMCTQSTNIIIIPENLFIVFI